MGLDLALKSVPAPTAACYTNNVWERMWREGTCNTSWSVWNIKHNSHAYDVFIARTLKIETCFVPVMITKEINLCFNQATLCFNCALLFHFVCIWHRKHCPMAYTKFCIHQYIVLLISASGYNHLFLCGKAPDFAALSVKLCYLVKLL